MRPELNEEHNFLRDKTVVIADENAWREERDGFLIYA